MQNSKGTRDESFAYIHKHIIQYKWRLMVGGEEEVSNKIPPAPCEVLQYNKIKENYIFFIENKINNDLQFLF